jgi:hypothetical protein
MKIPVFGDVKEVKDRFKIKIKNWWWNSIPGIYLTKSSVFLSATSSITTHTAEGVVSPGPTPMGIKLKETASTTLFPGDRVNG